MGGGGRAKGQRGAKGTEEGSSSEAKASGDKGEGGG